jgi:hypothetical protein
MVVSYADGKSATYRYIASMGKSGFLLSPTVTSAWDFLALNSMNWRSYLGKKMPVMFEIHSDDTALRAWRKSINVKFFKMPVRFDGQIDSVLFPSTRLSSVTDLPRTSDCSIDAINGAAPLGSPIRTADKVLRVDGWAAISRAKGITHEHVSLALVSPDGSARVYPATQIIRIDVGTALGNKKLEKTGFSGTVNLLQADMPTDIRIIQRRGSQSYLCDTTVHVVPT